MSRDDDLRAMSRRDLEREVVRLRALLEAQMSQAPGIGASVDVHGIVSFKTREPLVQMRAGEAGWQMDTTKARQHALLVLDAAVEAERDAATIDFLEHGVDLDEDRASAFLSQMREHRRDWFAALGR